MTDHDDGFWTRVQKARLLRVLAIYLGASWITLQVADVLRDALELPDWVTPVTVILLLVGLVILLATAWIQAHPLVERKEAADEVPGSWELALSELAEALREGDLPHPTWARALAGGLVAFSLLFGLAGVYVLLQDGGRSFAPTEAVAADAAPGVAVLPFDVSGTELGELGEGVVALLSTGIDGASGLRAVDSRTVLAAWEGRVGEGERADRETSLRVARSTGARYALLGSAVGVGSLARLSATVHDLRSGSVLGRVQVEGSPDSLLALSDQLAVEALGVLLEGGAVEDRPNLARVTTRSPTALKAFLEGEARYRRADFAGAIDAYERAVAEDSAFALAHYRLRLAWGWAHDRDLAAQRRHGQIALRHADRLPRREAALVVAAELYRTREPEAVDSLEKAVRRWPDDAEAWRLLGEARFHTAAPATPEEIEEAFARAIDLNPGFAPSYIHAIELAIDDRADSALAARRVEAYAGLAGRNRFTRRHALAMDLAFGTARAREAALASLDTVPLDVLEGFNNMLRHPRYRRVQEAGLEEWIDRVDEPGTSLLQEWAINAFRSGRLEEGVRRLEEWEESLGARAVCTRSLWLDMRGLPLPAGDPGPPAAEEVLSSEDEALTGCGSVRIAYRADLQAVRRLEDRLEERAAAADSNRRENFRIAGTVVRLVRLSRQGRHAEALEAWESLPEDVNVPPVLVANLHRRAGRVGDALRWYRAWRFDGWAELQAARIHDAAGRSEKALAAYRDFVAGWGDADEALRPMVREGEDRIAALEGRTR